MRRLSDELGTSRVIARIRAPGRSYADWHRFLEECREAGLAAVYGDANGESRAEFVTPFGYALLRRFRWLRDAEAMGLPYEEAEAAFGVGMERDADALRRADEDREASMLRAMQEREAADIFARAAELGL